MLGMYAKEIRLGTAPRSIDGLLARFVRRGNQHKRLSPLVVHREEKSPPVIYLYGEEDEASTSGCHCFSVMVAKE